MSKTRPKQYVEQPFNDFIRDRIEIIDIDIDINTIAKALDPANLASTTFMQAKIIIGVVSVIFTIIGLLILTDATLLSSTMIILAVSLTLIGVSGVFLAFHADELKMLIFLRSFVNDSDLNWRELLEIIFEPVQDETANLIEISPDGVGQSVTPNSGRSIYRHFSKVAPDELRFIEAVGQALNHKIELVVIKNQPRIDWYNFHLWDETNAPRLLDAFDNTPEIYKNNRIKRVKMRVALATIIPQARKSRRAKKKTGNKKPTVSLLAKNLEIEAISLTEKESITDEEVQQLCQLSLSGKPTADFQDIGPNDTQVPESWFLRLMSGDYSTVLGPITETLESTTSIKR